MADPRASSERHKRPCRWGIVGNWMQRVDRQRLQPRICDDLVRVGLLKDGGYVVPRSAMASATVLLSLGMKEDWSFETAFLEANPATRVIGVDPSVTPRFFAAQALRSGGRWAASVFRGERSGRVRHAWRLRNSLHYFWFFGLKHRHLVARVSAADREGSVSIRTLIERAGERDRRVFLKMDIEGGEYDVIEDVVAHQDRLSCVVAEFHRIGKQAAAFNNALARLQTAFQVVHVHGNNYRPFDAAHGVPDTVEITLLNRALMPQEAALTTWTYPRAGLDFPNRPNAPDYELRFD
jgi:hypothetical protein